MRARDTAVKTGKTLGEAIEACLLDKDLLSDSGSVSSSSGGGSSSGMSPAGGPGDITTKEVAEKWTVLLERYQVAVQWLDWCGRYGVDPKYGEDQNMQEAPNAEVANPQEATDEDIFEWLMGSRAVRGSRRMWPGKLNPLYEYRSDYSSVRVGAGPQWT